MRKQMIFSLQMIGCCCDSFLSSPVEVCTPGLMPFGCFHSDSMPTRMVLICFLSLVVLMSILGNLLVMVAVCKDRQLR